MDLGNLLGKTVVAGVNNAVAAFGKTFTPPPGGFSKALETALPIAGNIAKGIATVGGINTSGAVETISAAQELAGKLKFQSGSKFNPNRKGIPNPLENFASYTTVFTFACLKKEEVNNPYIYRNNDFVEKQVVFSSAGRYDKERVPTAFTRYGAPEYYIDNLYINSIIAPNQGTGNSSACEISFDIYEPYSVGLLLQSLNTAALYSGYPNYLTECPYVLKMEFLGYEEDGTIYSGAQPKFYVMTLQKVDFTVTEAGSNYKIQATPYNHSGFSEVMSQTFNDISLTGSTVEELLVKSDRSLQKALNDIAQKAAKDPGKTVEIPDRYEIHFPETANSPIPGIKSTEGADSATVNATGNSSNYNIRIKSASNAQNDTNFDSNTIGKSSFGFKADSGGNYVSPRAQDVYDSATGVVKRDNLTINPKTRTFQFAQEQSILSIISQAILSSDYATKALKDAKGDGNSRVDWFRIDCQIQLTDYDTKRGNYAKRIIYRVMPYKVHKSVFGSPESVPDYGTLQEELVKQYDYIYTGQNNDIIKFDILLDTAFYTAITPTPPSESGRSKNQDTQSAGEEERVAPGQSEGVNGVKAQTAATGSPTVKRDPKAIDLPTGGSGQIDPEYLVAQNFQQAFLDNGQTNLVSVRLDILGDPYWLTDNGIGGYLPGPGQTEMITEDGSANYEMGDIYIYVRFRSPLDVDTMSGMYDFSNGSVDSPFSGIYKVTKVESKFSGGTFTQNLECLRMPKQPNDFSSPVTPDNKSLYDLNKAAPEDNGILDDDDSIDQGPTLLAGGDNGPEEDNTEITYDA